MTNRLWQNIPTIHINYKILFELGDIDLWSCTDTWYKVSLLLYISVMKKNIPKIKPWSMRNALEESYKKTCDRKQQPSCCIFLQRVIKVFFRCWDFYRGNYFLKYCCLVAKKKRNIKLVNFLSSKMRVDPSCGWISMKFTSFELWKKKLTVVDGRESDDENDDPSLW